MNNVSSEVDEYCSGCGICQGVCPVRAIQINEKAGVLRPAVDDNCISCGLCVKMCPNREPKKSSYHDFEHVLWGHSCDINARREAASGGITTELLKYLKEKKIVDYIITANEYYADRKAEFCVVEGEDINQKAGSNYCPVNMGKVIDTIKNREGTCAIVCLPCFARGLKKIRRQDAELDGKVKFVITLLCNHVPSYQATEYLLRKYKIDSPDLIKYRGNGWFGEFRTYKKNVSLDIYSELKSVPFSKYFATAFSEQFWQKACAKCMDHFGIESDVCMGDADFVKYRDRSIENLGETICFTNNQEIKNILNMMAEDNRVELYSDVSEKELEEIYGPLSQENRAGNESFACNVNEILKKEKKEQRKRNRNSFKRKIRNFYHKIRRR